jgi:hypothetical protein
LNDYRELYEKHPNRAIAEVTTLVEKGLQAELTHIENPEMAPFHENVMRITRKGMNARNSDTKIPLYDRWRYSQNLAKWFNQNVTPENEPLMELKKDLSGYFALQKKLKVDEKYFYQYMTNPSTAKEWIFLLTMWPLMLLGMFHCGPWYFLIKRFVEKSFRRKVFHGSVKLLLGKIIMGLVNIPIVILMHKFLFQKMMVTTDGWLLFITSQSVYLD